MTIAVLLTCHNRKVKTINCLNNLYRAYTKSNSSIEFDIYLTDDGSTDGTAEEVKKQFPKTTILKSDGSLFWAKGMNNSWKEALKKNYDGYLLLNDDTNVYDNVFSQIIETNTFCIETFKQSGVYVGTTIDPVKKKLSYGGSVLLNKFLYTFKKLKPSGTPQQCDLGNANIMFVSNTVVEKVGILSKGYIHGVADYDYTLTCIKNKIPVLITPDFCGECVNDHKGLYHNFHLKTFRERIKHLYNPTGIAFKSRLLFMRKFFPYRYPIFYLMGWFKVLFPKFYMNQFTKR
ncbi:glycosyltransferase [uncultured Maribacter sp.]|uniref:glycosyltransferase family 2 protein n=1 Tax=uncultured Maribacter sp. TaxID=431308 RepID=UPI00263478ED|nr:glycosyltransferase [uncultured Maribacter sp.]